MILPRLSVHCQCCQKVIDKILMGQVYFLSPAYSYFKFPKKENYPTHELSKGHSLILLLCRDNNNDITCMTVKKIIKRK